MADKIVSWGGFDSKGIDGMGVTGSLGILNSNTSSSVLLDIVGSTNNSFTFRSNPVLNSGQNGLKVNVSTAGYDNNGSHLAYNFQVGGTSYFTIANYGLATFAQSIETKTMLLQYNPSNVTTLRVYAQGVAGNAIETGGSEGTVHLGSNTVNTKVNEILRITGKGTTSSTTALLVQDSAGTEYFKLTDDAALTFTGLTRLSITTATQINSRPVVFNTNGSSGGYSAGYDFKSGYGGFDGNTAFRIWSTFGTSRVAIGNVAENTIGNNNSKLYIDNTESGGRNKGIKLNVNFANISTEYNGIQFDTIENGSGGAFVGSQYNTSASSYGSDLVIFTTTESGAGSYTETARFVGKSQSLSIGAGKNPTATLHVSGSSNSALFEIDSPTQNNILYVSGSGRVGIGTGTPNYKLDVSGSSNFTGNMIITGSATNSLLVKGSGTTSATTSLLVQDSNGSSAFEVKDDRSATVYGPLTLGRANQGFIYATANDYIALPRQGGSAPGYLNTSTAGDGWAFRLAANNQTYARIMEGSFYLEAYTPNSNGRNSIRTWFSGSNFVYIDGDGVTGRSPAYGNGVNVVIRGGKSGGYENVDNRGAAGYVTVEGGSAFSSSFTTHVPAGGVNIQTGLGLGTGSAADLTFSTSTTSSVASTYHTQTQRMIIKGQTGFAGIGTSTPSASLHVSGTVLIDNILTLTPQDPLPTGVGTGSFAVSSSVPPKPYFYDGTSWNALY